jgi:hypothetical protein
VLSGTAPKSIESAPMKEIDNVMYFDIDKLNTWVFSSKFTAVIGSYTILILFMIIAAFIGVTTVLAQRPQLEK